MKLTVHCFSGSATVYEVDVEGEFVISVEEYAWKKPLVFFGEPTHKIIKLEIPVPVLIGDGKSKSDSSPHTLSKGWKILPTSLLDKTSYIYLSQPDLNLRFRQVVFEAANLVCLDLLSIPKP